MPRELMPALLILALALAPPLSAAPLGPGAGSATAADAAPALGELAALIDDVVAAVCARALASDRDSPWVILHAVIACGEQAEVDDGASGARLSAVDFLLRRAKADGRGIFRDDGSGLSLPLEGTDFVVQTHPDQFLMGFALAGVSLDRPLATDTGRLTTLAELLASSQHAFDLQAELGWTLVAYSIYLPPGARWTDRREEEHRIEDLLAASVFRDPRMETESGSHHLFGVAWALAAVSSAEPLSDGKLQRVAGYLNNFIDQTRLLQQDDGAFSAGGLRGSVAPQDSSNLVDTTGHTLEWLTVALSPARLREGWVERAARRLAAVLAAGPLDAFTPGGLYHAAHALRRYRDLALSPTHPPTTPGTGRGGTDLRATREKPAGGSAW